MNGVEVAGRRWVNASQAARLLGGVGARYIKLLSDKGLIGVRKLPGARVTYDRSDIERLAQEATTESEWSEAS
jgi:hypothetical protein